MLSYTEEEFEIKELDLVLILVLMEYALLQYLKIMKKNNIVLILVLMEYALLLCAIIICIIAGFVLILVLMEYALLLRHHKLVWWNAKMVLILVLMEYALLRLWK